MSRPGGTVDFGSAPAAPAENRPAPAAGGGPEQAARPAPAAPPPVTVVTGGGSAPSSAGGGPAAGPTVTPCSPNLLQIMLGLVTATLGGQGAC